MNIRPRARAIAASLIALSLFGGDAAAMPAQPAPEGAGARAAPADSDAAREHFDRGTAYFDKQQWREALGEYTKAMDLRRTAALMVNAALCMKFLGQYEDALDMLNAAMREFPGMSTGLRSRAAPAVTELEGLVGTLVVTGDTPSEASLFVDDRLRGKLPLPAPIAVGVGIHTIRAQKEGFDPITATVEVKARQQNTARLVGKSKKGLLEVNETHNWSLTVEVDGADVGVAPWKGLVDAGSHTVRLHGSLGLDLVQECAVPTGSADKAAGRAKMGSSKQSATVRAYETTSMKLSAEELDGPLRIESTPSGASLFIDKKEVGKTPWEGRLDLGERTVELRAPGFADASQAVKVERRREKTLRVSLEALGRASAEGQRKARTIGASIAFGMGALGLGTFGVTGGLALSKAKELEEACPEGTCNRSSDPDIDEASKLGTISVVGLVAGSLGVAVGTVVLLAVKPQEPAKSARRVLSPSVELSAGPLGLGLEGRF